MYEITYTDPYGGFWDFSDQIGDAVVERAGIEGLVGKLADKTTASTAWGGQVVTHQAPEPVTGYLNIVVRVDEKETVDLVYARLRSAFVPGRTGSLNIRGDRFGDHSAQVRLGGAIAEPEVDPDATHYIARVKIPLVIDSGVWLSEVFTDGGVVDVANPSPVALHVGAAWSVVSTVVLSSGWAIELPRVPGKRVVSFDPRTGYTVRDTAGVVDEVATAAVVKTAVPEPVPAGESRRYQTTGDAELRWQVPTLDPWL